MIILAIETSCDETAVSVVEFENQKVKILAETVSSQVKLHAPYGGVVPALAAREHLKNFVPVLKRALKRAGKKSDTKIPPTPFNKGGTFIDYIAVTNGPGLIPALMIGVSAAKALAYAWQKPLIPIHHIEGHIYANWIKKFIKSKVHKVHKVEEGGTPSVFKDTGCPAPNDYELWRPEFPVLCLIVSGGHTQLVLMKKDLSYKIIGETRDDAAGEAFDKVAKLLGLEYPGGPIIEKLAKRGDKNKFKFPRPMINSKDFDFSFSGLKTAALYKWKLENKEKKLEIGNWKLGNGTDGTNEMKADVAASFQQAAFDVLIAKTLAAAKKYKAKNILLGGGVSANKELQKQFREAVEKEPPPAPSFARRGLRGGFQFPNANLSTDNATMIAVAAYYRIINNKDIKEWKSVRADAGLKLK